MINAMKSRLIAIAVLLCLLASAVSAATIDFVDYNVGELHEGQKVKLDVRFNGEVNGELRLYSNNTEFARKEVSSNTIFEFKVPAPVKTADGDDMYDLKIRYYENNKEADKKELGQFLGNLVYVKDGKEEYKMIQATPKIPTLSDWGSIDFRVLKSEKEADQPVEVVINNLLDKDVEVGITIRSVPVWDEGYGTTSQDRWVLKPGKNNRRFEFSVKDNETKNDIEVVANYNEDEIAELQNTLIRLDPAYIKGGELPARPGEILNKEIEKAEKQLLSPAKEEKSPAKIIALSIAGALILIIAGMVYWLYRK